MSLTSLGLASEGLLDRGFSPALHIATLGHLRGGVIDDVPTGGGGGGVTRIAKITAKHEQRLVRATKRLKGVSRKIVDEMQPELVDVGALEAAIIEAMRQVPDLPKRESIAAYGKAPRIDLGAVVAEVETLPGELVDDLRLRLLLLGDYK